MDIILDTNIFAADYGMRSARFSSLFDYLRRTDDRLIVLDAVKTELLELFRRQLVEGTARAKSAWESLKRLIPTLGHFPEPEIDESVNELSQRLRNGPNGVKMSPSNPTIDLLEVVRRGAKRIAPANQNGEELRDVIIWLSALQFAKEKREAVAFISSDKGFWNGDAVHGQISEDLAILADSLKLYSDIDSFSSHNNLRSTVIDEHWISTFVDITTLKERVLEHLKYQLSLDFPYDLFETALNDVVFVSGTSYEISSAAMFLEFKCAIRASIERTVKVAADYPRWFGAPIELFNNDPRKSASLFVNESSLRSGIVSSGDILSYGIGKPVNLAFNSYQFMPAYQGSVFRVLPPIVTGRSTFLRAGC